MEEEPFAKKSGLREATRTEVREVQLSILTDLLQYCDKEGLDVYLAYGTLIGAVRHSGYIPWDDDIDVWMPRSSYSKLLKSSGIGDQLEFLAPHDRSSIYPFSKLYKKNTCFVEDVESTVDGIGINIDVFPLDHVPTNAFLRFVKTASVEVLKLFLLLKVVSPSKQRSAAKNFVLAIGSASLRLVPTWILVRSIDRTSRRCTGKSSSLGCYVGPYGKRDRYSNSSFYGSDSVKFENVTAPVPKGYHQVLQKLYGDYRKLPPKNQRTTHHRYRAYVEV